MEIDSHPFIFIEFVNAPFEKEWKRYNANSSIVPSGYRFLNPTRDVPVRRRFIRSFIPK